MQSCIYSGSDSKPHRNLGPINTDSKPNIDIDNLYNIYKYTQIGAVTAPGRGRGGEYSQDRWLWVHFYFSLFPNLTNLVYEDPLNSAHTPVYICIVKAH